MCRLTTLLHNTIPRALLLYTHIHTNIPKLVTAELLLSHPQWGLSTPQFLSAASRMLPARTCANRLWALPSAEQATHFSSSTASSSSLYCHKSNSLTRHHYQKRIFP